MTTSDSNDSASTMMPSAESYVAFSKSKRMEWSVKCAYPRTKMIEQLRSKLALGQSNNYFCFDTQQLSEFTETLRLLGWTGIDALDPRALERLDLANDSLLIVGPEVAAALRQREDHSRFACCLTYWEQRLHCLDSYWTLHDTLESFEQSLRMFSRMGLLGDLLPRISYRDILLPTVHLGEVWGRRLSLFLKAHDCFRVKRTSVPTSKSGEMTAAAAATAATADLIYEPTSSEKSGRKRLEALTEKLSENYCCGEDAHGPVAWSGLILQAHPETQPMLVMDRQFTLETFLLLAPRRNPTVFGFAAFFHPGLVRVNAAISESPQAASSTGGCSCGQTFTWIPDQLSDYLAVLNPDRCDWLKCSVYPQMEAACAYLATALTQQLLDSALSRFHLLRLSFVVDAEKRKPRLTDLSQRIGSQAAVMDYCESLVLPRLLQEAALIVAELLLGSGGCDQRLPARSLVTPRNMKLVYDSADPAVQRGILSRTTNLTADATGSPRNTL